LIFYKKTTQIKVPESQFKKFHIELKKVPQVYLPSSTFNDNGYQFSMRKILAMSGKKFTHIYNLLLLYKKFQPLSKIFHLQGKKVPYFNLLCSKNMIEKLKSLIINTKNYSINHSNYCCDLILVNPINAHLNACQVQVIATVQFGYNCQIALGSYRL
jgi:hypothetical protein